MVNAYEFSIQRLLEKAKDLSLDFLFSIIERLHINEATLVDEYADQASLFAYVASLQAEYKITRDTYESELFLAARVVALKHGEKITDKYLNHIISSDDGLFELRHQSKFIKALKEAFEQKNRMLISMGADLREERKSTAMYMSGDTRQEYTSNLAEKAHEIMSKSKKPVKVKKNKKLRKGVTND